MWRAQSIDPVLPASFIESLSSHRPGSFSTTGAALCAGFPFKRLKTLMSNAASFAPSWNFGANGTWVMPAGGTHPVLAWQVAR
jgi:hypothetical protein